MAKTFYTDCNVEQNDGTKQKYRITITPEPKNCGGCPFEACGCYEDTFVCNLTGNEINYNDLDKIAKDCPLIEV